MGKHTINNAIFCTKFVLLKRKNGHIKHPFLYKSDLEIKVLVGKEYTRLRGIFVRLQSLPRT